MPIYCADELAGGIYLVDKETGRGFSDEDERIAAMFAAQAASIISNSRRYEEARRAKVDLETLMDISPVAVSVFDTRKGQITFLNRESRRMLGALGVPDHEMDNIYASLRFSRPDGREIPFEDLPGIRVLQTGESVRAEELVTHLPNGNKITTLVSCAPLFSESGEMVSVLSVFQDMTPLEDVERQRSEFLGMVSEELRTPLLSVKGSAAALRSILEPDNATESLQLLRIMDQQIDLVRSQVNNLTELTQIEAGSLSVATEPTGVAGLIESSCREYLEDHPGIAIKLDMPEGMPTVMADRRRMTQVLHNFLRRAARHSNESSPIKVSAAVGDIYVAVSVAAQGSSTPPETLPSPFENADPPALFGRISTAHNREAELSSRGEGLAIAFCRGVVEAHDGRVRIEIDEERGLLELTFTLPMAEGEETVPVANASEIGRETTPASVDKTNILVSIEDPQLLRTVRQVLLDEGYGAITTSGLDEVESLAVSEGPKLVVVDISGREEAAFRTLRGVGNALNLPAIVLCDRGDEEYVVRVFEMGADGYMVKPFSSYEMIARIKAVLRRLSARREPAGNHEFQLGDVRVNFNERTVNVSGQPVQLTATEYNLLTEFANSGGRVLTQDQLLDRVWGPEYSGESQLLRSYVKSLRQKLGDNARKPTYIFTEHGIGYRMVKFSPVSNRPGSVGSTSSATSRVPSFSS